MLGRGLADLLPVGGDGGSNRDALDTGQHLPIATLHPNPRQPRTRFDETALAELTESVRLNGIIQPILARPRTAGGYEIVAGERRYRAALRAGLKDVPVVVRQLTDDETLALALIENLIREDIGPLETARAFQRLMDDFGWTQEEMGKRVGKSRPAVANSLRLLDLPIPIQESLERNEISEGHARSLLGDREQREEPTFKKHQLTVWKQIVGKNLSVRECERMMKVHREGAGSPSGSARTDVSRETLRQTEREAAEHRALEDRLRTAMGTQVRLVGNAERGRIEVEFFSSEELDGLLTKLETSPRTGKHQDTRPSAGSASADTKVAAAASAVSGRSKPNSGPIQGLLSSRLPPR